jgi:hypothetical protein
MILVSYWRSIVEEKKTHDIFCRVTTQERGITEITNSQGKPEGVLISVMPPL